MTSPKLDAQKLRADFAVFEELTNGKPRRLPRLGVVDPEAAPGARRDEGVLRALVRERPPRRLRARRACDGGLEGAREKVRAFVNAPSNREVIFIRSSTEALNLIAYAWGLENLGPGDVVVITELEHHANFVPWQFIAKKTGAQFAHIPIDDHGELQLDALDEIASRGNVKVVANNLVSNTLGTINPVEKLAAWAHEQGAIMVVDAAQAAPHKQIDVQALGCDFLVFSSHKLCGPSGAGALWGRRELLEDMQPFNFGGEMIRSVALDRTSWNELPYKFEAGTPAIAEAFGFGVAIDYVSGDRPRRDRGARARARRRPRWTGSARSRACASSGRRPSGAPGSSASSSRACIRTTSRRSSTGKASRSAPATTARSR